MSVVEGELIRYDPRDKEIAQLEKNTEQLQQALDVAELENKQLRNELTMAKIEAANAWKVANRSVAALRRQLTPLYSALKAVFGEIEAVDPNGDGERMPMPSRVDAVWVSWKEKLPGKPAQFIEIFLTHGPVTAAQLKVLGKCASQTVYDTISKMNKAGLIQKNGGKYSLKTL